MAGEPVSPRSFFDEEQYYCFKALSYFQEKKHGGFSREAIRADMPRFVATIRGNLAAAGLDAWTHFTKYGTSEGINPSNEFDTVAYLKAKANALNRAGLRNGGRPWDWVSAGKSMQKAHMNALEHFVRFAGKGPQEAPFGLTSSGSIPAQYTVPEADRLPFGCGGADGRIFTVKAESNGVSSPKKNASGRSTGGKRRPKRDPKDFFNPGEYIQFKALEYFQRPEQGGLTAEQIRRNMPLYAAEILHALNKAGLDSWKHYQLYGTLEGVNPSNAFDTVSYLQAKAEAMNAANLTDHGAVWDAERVANAFKKAHLCALEHFLLYAGTGRGEVEAGLTEDGEIPEDFRVSDAMQVSTAVLSDPRFDPTPANPPAIPSPQKSAVQFAGKRAVALPSGGEDAGDLVLKGTGSVDRLPEYSISFLPKTPDWQNIVYGVHNQLWRKSRARRLVTLVVLLPGLFVFFYLLLWASNAYISETKFAVRSQNGSQNLEGFSTFFSIPSATQNDSYIVMNYIQSYDLFSKLDRDLGLREHYSDTKNDIWFRLSKDATQEDILEFWKWACEVSYDPDTSILEVQVKAFSPEKALAVCEGILKHSEELVNAMNVRSRQDAIRQAETEVSRAEDRVRRAREAMHAYRERTVILDPEAVATGLYGVVNKLEADVTKTAAELSEAKSYMKSGSPRVRQLENRLDVLSKQLAKEKKRLAGKVKDDQSLNDLLSGFQTLAIEEEFAQKQLTSAMTSLEAARVRADAQSQYVEAFQRPVLADESLYPRPVLFSFIYMLTSLLLLGLLSLIVAAVREHAGF